MKFAFLNGYIKEVMIVKELPRFQDMESFLWASMNTCYCELRDEFPIEIWQIELCLFSYYDMDDGQHKFTNSMLWWHSRSWSIWCLLFILWYSYGVPSSKFTLPSVIEDGWGSFIKEWEITLLLLRTSHMFHFPWLFYGIDISKGHGLGSNRTEPLSHGLTVYWFQKYLMVWIFDKRFSFGSKTRVYRFIGL